MRGYTGFDLTVYGAARYLHSGHYGNWAPNPAMRLSQLLATMKDGEGKVTIEGFYDSVAPLTDADREALKTLPDYDDELRRELGLAATEGGDATLAERLLLPSFNVRGMESGAVGEAARNVIPTEATASLDIRLVKANDPAEMIDLVEAHIRKDRVGEEIYASIFKKIDLGDFVGIVGTPMRTKTNELTFPSFDPYSRQPSYKACAVEIRKFEYWEKK